jgi:tetratricopeptide (TPR) repeat protein
MRFRWTRAVTAFILFLCGIVLPGTAQEERGFSLGLSATPEAAVPVGGNAEYYELGYGGRLTGLFGLPATSLIAPRFDLSYNYIPLSSKAAAQLSLVRASAGLQAGVVFGERFSLYGYGTVGGYYGLVDGPSSATDAYLSYHGGAGGAFQLFDDISLALGAEYGSYVGTVDVLAVTLGVTARLAGPGGGAVPLSSVTPLRPETMPAGGYIEIREVQLETVFPVLRKYYDSTPIGTAEIVNVGNEPLENVEVRVRPSTYIDSPKLSARVASLEPGQRERVDLYVLFNEEILSVSEGAKVVTDIEAAYRVNGRDGEDTETVTLTTYDRNAMQWDDDRKIAAFVTAKDDEIQRFAKNMASLDRELPAAAVNPQLQLAMIEYTAMAAGGLTYVVDPSSSYELLSEDPLAVDYVQFPRQTLYVKAGDCDDLSAAYATLLESVGIDTAFITVPGHIFMAFRLETTEAKARKNFSRPQDLIIRKDGTVWLPVETTMLEDGFLAAWDEGARQWRTYEREGQAGFFRTGEAWSSYQPVAFSVSTIELGIPKREQVVADIRRQLAAFTEREIRPRERDLRARLESRPNDPRLLNRLGILYARYGRYGQAKEIFAEVVAKRKYVPSLINLANLHYLEDDLGSARRRYEQALEQRSGNAVALLGLARVEHKMENFGSARRAYEQLASVSPELAEENSYLLSRDAGDETGRAGSPAAQLREVVWEEGE